MPSGVSRPADALCQSHPAQRVLEGHQEHLHHGGNPGELGPGPRGGGFFSPHIGSLDLTYMSRGQTNQLSQTCHMCTSSVSTNTAHYLDTFQHYFWEPSFFLL